MWSGSSTRSPSVATPAGCIAVPLGSLSDNFTGPHALAGADGTADTFSNVPSSSQICIDVTAKTNNSVAVMPVPQAFTARLLLEGRSLGAAAQLGAHDLVFVVPGPSK